MILNQQKEVALDLPAARVFARRLRRVLRLGRRDFNVCFVNDREIERLNAAYRGIPRPTDVLSFPWHAGRARSETAVANAELLNFLGDVAISAETARRNARAEGHSTRNEICWLILHGVLHLLGYDHERDRGEMTRLELVLREQLRITDLRVQRKQKRQAKSLHG